MIVDSHHHFWRYSPEEYGWIDDAMAAIRRDFLPQDLLTEITAAGVSGVVSVQARQSLVETEWLLAFAQQHAFIWGVVGWVPLVSPRVRESLERFADQPKLKSIRHVLQGEADERYLLRDDFNEGIRCLKAFGLAYDILILEQHLPQTIEFVDRHPNQVFVVDHIAKPRIKAHVLEPWRTQLRELAKRKNVFCKLSGLVTEADTTAWTLLDLKPYVETVLESFGPRRIMFGTDWPVSTVASPYSRWIETVRGFISSCSPDEQTAVWSGTACQAYRLQPDQFKRSQDSGARSQEKEKVTDS